MARIKSNKKKSSKKKQTVSKIPSSADVSMLENRHYGVVIMDARSFRILFANALMGRMTGYARVDLKNLDLFDIIAPEDHKRFKQAFRARMAGRPYKGDNRYSAVKKNGRRFILEAYSNPIEYNGKKCLQSIVRDVTGRVTLEDELQESRARYESIFELSPDAIIITNAQGHIIAVNKSARNVLGYGKSYLTGKKIIDLPLFRENNENLDTLLSATAKNKTYRTRLSCSGGRKIEAEILSSRMSSQNGNPEYLLIIRDISGQAEYERNLLESEKKYRELVENMPDGIGIVHKGRYVYATARLGRIFGSSPASMTGRRASSIIAHKYKKKFNAAIREVEQNGVSRSLDELEGIDKKGNRLFISVHVSRADFDGRDSVQITFTDITSQVKAERELRDVQVRYRSLVENSYYGFYLADPDSQKFTYVNKAASRLLRRLVGKQKSYSFLDFLNLTDRKKLEKKMQLRRAGKADRNSGRMRLNLPNGEHVWLEFESSVIKYAGKPIVQGVFRDVTDHYEAEKKLHESEERFRQIAENSPDVFWIIDRYPDRTIYISPAYEKIFNRKLKDVYRNNNLYLDLVHPDDYERIAKRFNRLDRETDDEYRIILDDGEVRWLRSRTFPVKDKNGNVYRTAGIVRDITVRKEAEIALRQSEERYRAVVEEQTDLICRGDLEFRLFFVNDAYCRYFDMEREEIIGKSFMPLVYEEDVDRVASAIDDLGRDNPLVRVEIRVNHPDGSIRWQQWINRAIFDEDGEITEILAVGRDITEQKKTEQALRESELRFRAIFENTSDGIAVFERRFGSDRLKLIECNDRYVEFSGRDKEELLQIGDVRKLQIGDNSPRRRGEIRKHAEKGRLYKGTFSWKRPDGAENYIDYEAAPVIIGERILIYAIDREVTAGRRNEFRIRASEQKYRNLYDSLMDGFAQVDMDGKIIEINDIFATMLGYPRDKIGKLSYQDITPKKWHKIEEKILKQQVLKRGYSEIYEKEYIDSKGRIFPVELRTYLMRDNAGEPNGMWAIVRDISERKQSEEKLRESEEKYRSVIDNIGIGISLISPDMRILSLNKQMREWFPDIDVDQNPVCFRAYNNPPRERVCSYCPTIRTIQDGRVHEDISETPRGDEIRNYKIISSPIKNQDGEVIYAIEMVDDITERIRAEEEIQKFKTISDLAAYGTAIADMNGRLVYVNESWAKMHGYSEDYLIGKSLEILHSPQQLPRVRFLVENLKKTGKTSTIEVWHMKKDGTEFPTLMSSTVISDNEGKPIYISATAIDITERKRAEQALRESEEKFRQISEQSMLGIVIVQNNQFKFANQAVADLAGYPLDQVREWSLEDGLKLIHPDDVQYVRQKYTDQSPSRDEDEHHAAFRIYTSRGEMRWIDHFSKLIQFEGESAILAMVIDITDRMHAETALIEERDRLRLIFEHLPVMAIAFDEEMNIIAWNRAAEKITGYKSSEILNRSDALKKLCRGSQESKAVMDKLSRSRSKDDNWEWHIITKSGEEKIISWYSVSSQIAVPGFTVWGIGLDVTEKKKAELALKNQRDVLRDVTGDVIKVQEEERRRISMELHDSIGQSLSVIKLQLQNLLSTIKSNPETAFSGLRSTSNLVSETIADLRQISANLRPVILDNLGLWPTIDWYLKDFSKKADLEVAIEMEKGLPNLEPSKEVHFFRVIQEIMINIQKHSDADQIAFKGSRRDSQLEIRIDENGQGFDIKKIFDPGHRIRGMGIINIIERVNILKGKLDIDSAPGQGSRFTVSVPIE